MLCITVEWRLLDNDDDDNVLHEQDIQTLPEHVATDSRFFVYERESCSHFPPAQFNAWIQQSMKDASQTKRGPDASTAVSTKKTNSCGGTDQEGVATDRSTADKVDSDARLFLSSRLHRDLPRSSMVATRI